MLTLPSSFRVSATSFDPQEQGSTRDYRIELARRDGTSLLGVFAGTETFRAYLWAGDDQRPVWSSNTAVAWDPALAGNPTALDTPALRLEITATDTATITPGRYYLQIKLNPGIDDIAILPPGCTYELTPSPATTVAPRTYCSYDDVIDVAPWLPTAAKKATWLTADFGEQRGMARAEIDDTVMCRVKRIIRDQHRRHAPVKISDPIVPTDGIDAGPWWGISTIPDTSERDAIAAFRTLLDADRLMRSARLVEIAANLTVYYVCRTLITSDSMNPYRGQGKDAWNRAMVMLAGWDAYLDTNADGTADYGPI